MPLGILCSQKHLLIATETLTRLAVLLTEWHIAAQVICCLVVH